MRWLGILWAALRGRLRKLRRAERRLLETACGAGTKELLLLTSSRVDVGQWLSRGRLWLAWTDGALLLFATGKRPFVERLAAADLAESLYNPVTAELVLLPAAETRQRTVRVAPVEGWNLLERIKRENRKHA